MTFDPPYLKLSKGLFLLSLFTIGCGQQETAKQPSDTQNKYETYLSEVFARGQFNGNAMVIDDGEVVFQGAYGIGNIDPIDTLNLNSVFRMGSVSKQFTTMGIMILKEQGKLDYDQDMRDFIPELPYEGVTIRHLMNHVSGLPDYVGLMNDNWQPALDMDDPGKAISGNDDIINTMAALKPEVYFEPGESWEYSNTGYVILATIASRAAGMPFEDFLAENVFKPAGMKNSAVYNYVQGPDTKMPNKVFGYRLALNGTDREYEDFHFLNPVQGDGGVYSTLEDLRNWDQTLYTEKLISAATLEEAFTPAILTNGDTTDYGFGWSIGRSLTNKKVVEHGGSWVGFRTFIYRGIEEDDCVIVLTNNSSTTMYDIAMGLVHLLHDREADIPALSIKDEIGRVLFSEGIDPAVEHYKKLRAEQPDAFDFGEFELNIFGYQLLAQDKIDEAIAILELNMEQFPESANPCDSYGDALLVSGDTANAILNFEKAFELDPTLTFIPEKIRDLSE